MYEMKESGIEWIGQIPKHWEVRKIKYLYNIEKAKLPSMFIDDNRFIPYMTMEYIRGNNTLVQYARNGTLCHKNDILILWDGSNAGEIIYTHPVGYAPSTTAILRYKSTNYIHDYFKYNLKSLEKDLRANINGMGIPHVNGYYFNNSFIPFPPLNEQKKIADFLDNKVSKTDDLISDTKNLINKYKEYKQSLITETVTKGLNHKVEMKNSGIEWIGRIPKHWKVKIIQELFYNLKHRNIGIKEKNLLSLSYGKIINKDIYSNYGLLPVNFNNYNIVKYDDIVLRLTDLQNDKKSLRVGHVREKGIITSAYITLRPLFHYSSRYYYFLLHSYDICKYFYSLGSGVRQSLTFEEVKKILLLLPPIDEQEEIVKYLDDKCQQIDSIIEEKQALIEKLEEYKKSLIYEYVTGKKQVEDE